MKIKAVIVSICLALTCAMCINLAGCTVVHAEDLMEDVIPSAVTGKEDDNDFRESQMELSIKLFRAMSEASGEKNVLISPLSIELALAMTANGAKGKTLDEMQELLGGDITIDELNEYLYSYVNSLPSGEKYKVDIANSIWIRDEEGRLTIEDNFLKKNADYYGAAAYKAPFDSSTVRDINNWVNDNTDGMIDKVIEEIPYDAIMYLINALVFDAEWQKIYERNEIYDGVFTTEAGEERDVQMMFSSESKYFKTDSAKGFFKNYKDAKYSFVGILPDEDMTLDEYIASLDGEELLAVLDGAENGMVNVDLPKFEYEYELEMNNVLKSLGMPTAFDSQNADFTGIGRSIYDNIFICRVLHKTHIKVDERGTKAGAVTVIEMFDCGAAMPPLTITLDRPFVYMIIDNETNLPIFMGCVRDIGK